MVNNQPHRLLVPGACRTRAGSGDRTLITNGPVYDLPEAQKLLRANGLRVINERAQEDQKAFTPEMSDDELTKFILALVPDDRVGSERCGTSVGLTLDCDGYAMKWNRNRSIRWEYGAKIYVKFGFSLQSPRCLVVRIHPSRW
jgi:hypothetical protein